jgi:hypothetical protein
MIVASRFLVLALLLAPAVAPAQVNSPRPGGAPPTLPSHIQAQLWPDRELSPLEQQLKNHVVTLADSLTRIDAVGSRIDRSLRSAASPAMIRSNARVLAGDCSSAGRATAPIIPFAETLVTNDAKWGEPAVRGWRSALGTLAQELAVCEQSAAALAEAEVAPSAERLEQNASRIRRALVTYRRAEQGLIRTLKIEIDPAKKTR